MSLPTGLRILGHRYRVRAVDSGLFDDDNSLGECHWPINEIRILDALPERRRPEVLLHEILEALNAECCLELEHKQLGTLSATLHSVLRDNKGLGEYLGRGA